MTKLLNLPVHGGAKERMRKEIIGDCTLYLGDARDRDWTADAIITDPVWPNCPPDMLPGANNPTALFNSVLEKISSKRLVAVMRSDSDPAMLSMVTKATRLPFFRIAALPYILPSYNGRKLVGDEYAYCYGEPIPSAPGKRLIPGIGPKVKTTKKNGHPCPRNIDHLKWIVNWWSVKGETVLDPFMGSGTTGEACVHLGRKFIGCEIKQEYFDIACKRIESAWIGRPIICTGFSKILYEKGCQS